MTRWQDRPSLSPVRQPCCEVQSLDCSACAVGCPCCDWHQHAACTTCFVLMHRIRSHSCASWPAGNVHACACHASQACFSLAAALVRRSGACPTLSNSLFPAQGESLNKLSKGDISEVIQTALTNAVSITAPVFFQNNGGPQSTLTSASEPFFVTCRTHPLISSDHSWRLAKASAPRRPASLHIAACSPLLGVYSIQHSSCFCRRTCCALSYRPQVAISNSSLSVSRIAHVGSRGPK